MTSSSRYIPSWLSTPKDLILPSQPEVLLSLCLLFDKVPANVLVGEQQYTKDYFLAVLVGFLSCLWLF